MLPLRVIVDDHCGTPEDWAGLTGAVGYAGTCFFRVADVGAAAPRGTIGGGGEVLGGVCPGDDVSDQ